MEGTLIYFYSKYSNNCREFNKLIVPIKDTLNIQPICIDNVQVREIVSSNLKEVPAILHIKNESDSPLYEGKSAFEWVAYILQNNPEFNSSNKPMDAPLANAPLANAPLANSRKKVEVVQEEEPEDKRSLIAKMRVGEGGISIDKKQTAPEPPVSEEEKAALIAQMRNGSSGGENIPIRDSRNAGIKEMAKKMMESRDETVTLGGMSGLPQSL